MVRNILKKKIPPILKYPGGKNRELKHIIANLPDEIINYYEPFVGGGSVFFSMDVEQYYINDKSTELMNVYSSIKYKNKEFIKTLNDFNHNWSVMSDVIDNHSNDLINIYVKFKGDLITKKELKSIINKFVTDNAVEFNGILEPTFNVRLDNFIQLLEANIINKMVRMKAIEAKKGDLSSEDLMKNIEVSFKGAFYMHFRYLYNIKEELLSNEEISPGYSTALFVFIRQYCYSSMFRFNKNGEFNVPYGGISYNRKSLIRNIENYTSVEMDEHLSKTTLGNLDFYEFMEKYPPRYGDFIFIDPPYDTEFSTYDKNIFDQNDQVRLANYLINECKGNFMIIIKYTEFIAGLYQSGIKTANSNEISVKMFDKKYSVSFKDRNDKDVVHMIITNY